MSTANEYFRFVFAAHVVAAINQLRTEVLPNNTYTDVHLTVYFVGKTHLTDYQRAVLSPIIAEFTADPIEWVVKGVRVGDFSPVVFLELDFADPSHQARYQALYEFIYTKFDEWGLTQNTTGATAKQHPTCHLTLTWATDFAHAAELVPQFEAAPSMPAIGTSFTSTGFQLYHNDGTIIQTFP